MQRRGARPETLVLRVRFCVIFSSDVSHEFAHCVPVVVRRPERVLANQPPRWENYKVNDCLAWVVALASEHCENARIRVIVAYRADCVEFPQIILVRGVVASPGHDIERRVILCVDEKFPVILADNLPLALILLEVADGRLKVLWTG